MFPPSLQRAGSDRPAQGPEQSQGWAVVLTIRRLTCLRSAAPSESSNVGLVGSQGPGPAGLDPLSVGSLQDILLCFSEVSKSDFSFPHRAASELDKCLASCVLRLTTLNLPDSHPHAFALPGLSLHPQPLTRAGQQRPGQNTLRPSSHLSGPIPSLRLQPLSLFP